MPMDGFYRKCGAISELDETILGLAHAVNLPLPLRDSGSERCRSGIRTSFRTIVSSQADVRVVGRVHVGAARRILECIALEEEFRLRFEAGAHVILFL